MIDGHADMGQTDDGEYGMSLVNGLKVVGIEDRNMGKVVCGKLLVVR